MGAMGAAMGSTASGPFDRADIVIVVLLGGVTFAEVAMLEQIMADTGKQVTLHRKTVSLQQINRSHLYYFTTRCFVNV